MNRLLVVSCYVRSNIFKFQILFNSKYITLFPDIVMIETIRPVFPVASKYFFSGSDYQQSNIMDFTFL